MVTSDAILLGGGSGRRFKSEIPKQFQLIGGRPVFAHAVLRLDTLGVIRNFVLVVPKEQQTLAEAQIREYLPPALVQRTFLVTGGDRRQDSSRLALEWMENFVLPPSRVLIHDACRPYLSSELLSHIREALMDRSYGAWVPVVPVVETLKRVENHQIIETIDRQAVHRVQTPQVFEYSVIRSLVERAQELPEQTFTDDASLCEYYGIPVGAFAGDVRNLKLTFEFEKHTLSFLLQSEPNRCETESDSTFTV